MNEDESTIVCIMCNGVVAYDNYDKTKFFKHLRHDHSIFFNKLFIMAVNSFGEKTREQITNQFEKSGNVESDAKMNDGFDLEVINKNINNTLEDINKSEVNSNELGMPKNNEISIPGKLTNPSNFTNKEQSRIEPYDRVIYHKRKILDEPLVKTTNINTYAPDDTIEDLDIPPSGPKMETFIQEELAPSKDIPENVILEQAYKLARVTVKEVSGYNEKIPSLDVEIKSEKNVEELSNNKKSANAKIDRDRFRKEAFICELCNFSSFDHSKVWYHKQTHKAKFTCAVCKKAFSSKGNLKLHMNIHTHEKIHQCTVCGKSFNFKSESQKHEYTHGKKKPYNCELCEKGFVEKRHLNNHIIGFHKGEKPFICPNCGTCFVTKQNLKIHEKAMHSNDRPYSCQNCTKSFKLSHILSNHMRIHSGDKPFVCEVCQKAFSQSGTLANHKKFHKNIMDPGSRKNKKSLL